MGYSNVTICNKALSLLSADNILNFYEDTKSGIQVRSQYHVVRKTVLEDHSWSFALKRRVILKQSESPVYGYSSKFLKPADCLRILKVSDTEHEYNPCFEWVTEGRDILCNSDKIYLQYIYDNDVPDTYSSSFVDALSTRLAAELSYTVTNSDKLYSVLIQQYGLKITNSVNSDSLQGVNVKLSNIAFAR